MLWRYVFAPKLENWIFADGTITTGGNNSVETTWQRERKLVTIPWYTEVYFERAYTDVKDKTIFGSTVSFILSQANKRHDL